MLEHAGKYHYIVVIGNVKSTTVKSTLEVSLNSGIVVYSPPR
jgi:hypothetical protein